MFSDHQALRDINSQKKGGHRCQVVRVTL